MKAEAACVIPQSRDGLTAEGAETAGKERDWRGRLCGLCELCGSIFLPGAACIPDDFISP